MEYLEALVRYEVGLWNAVDRELAQRDRLGLGQVLALRVLERYRGEARVQDLSDSIGITVGAASKLTDRLERDDLVTRRVNPANRRSSLISLTGTGSRALADATATAETVVEQVLRGEDASGLLAVIARLQEHLDRTPTPTAA